MRHLFAAKEVSMKSLLLVLGLLALVSATAMATGPDISFGTGVEPITLPVREDVCQYGFVDMWQGSGYTLGWGQQLGIACAGPTTILRVGAFFEFIPTPGTCDIVVLDNGVEVSRTPVQVVNPGNNEYDIPDTYVGGTACIMLCGVADFWAVTGEDTNAPISGQSYWSNACQCTNAFTSEDLTIWAVYGGATPATETTWGALRSLFR
jgi:hypothetical protein